jgi:hypothetical protein
VNTTADPIYAKQGGGNASRQILVGGALAMLSTYTYDTNGNNSVGPNWGNLCYNGV